MKRKGLILLGIVLVFGTLAFWGLNRMVVSVRSSEIVLPDGTVLSVESISYGKKHILRGKGSRLIDKFLPLRELGRYESNQDELVLFLRLPPQMTTSSSPNFPNQYFLHKSQIYQFEIRDDTGGFSQDISLGINSQYQSHFRMSSSHFPRRGKWLTLTFLDRNHKLLGTIRFPNPAPNPPQQWQSDTFPITQTQDDIALTLEEPKILTLIYRNNIPLNPKQPSYTAQEMAERGVKEGETLFRRLTYTVKENGKPSRDWGIWTASEEDIYGHKTHRHTGAASSHIADYHIDLPTNENVRLKFVLQKRTSAPVKPEEIWSFAPIVLPSEQNTVTLPKVKPLPDGIEIVKGEVTSAKAYKANARGYAVAFEVKGLPETSRFVLEAKDENGKSVGNSYARHWMDTDKKNNSSLSFLSQGKPSGVTRYTFVVEAQKPLKQLTLAARVLSGKVFSFTLPGTYKPPK